MEGLSIEQKAKAYDEALEKARQLCAYPTSKPFISDLQDLFPELAESEDERIRKDIISLVIKWWKDDGEVESKFSSKNSMLAWLEKRGEPTDIPADAVLDGNKDGLIADTVRRKREKQGEWSEEDEELCEHLIKGIEELDPLPTSIYSDCKRWLKNLKYRLLSQNTTVTDEELIQAKKDAYNDALDKIEYHSGEPTFDDGWSAAIWYLKKRNAQPQSQIWKPSDGQMDAITCAVRRMKESTCYDSELLHLLQDLKKLREE